MRVGGETEFFEDEAGGEELVQARFEKGRFAVIELRDRRRVEVNAGHLEVARAAGRGDTTEMPEAGDSQVHLKAIIVVSAPTGFPAAIAAS